MTAIGWRNNQGVTLLEVILALSISAMIVLMGFRMYMVYRKQVDVDAVKYNVDVLFQAMTRYFQANCDKPQFTSPLQPILSVSAVTLRNQGYLTQNLLQDGLLDYGPASLGQYITQFNQVRVGGTLPQRMINISPSGSRTMGSIIMWRIQVSVNLADQTSVDAMLGPLGGDCINGAGSSYVFPCATPGGGAPRFIAWERLPSLSSSQYNSSMWQIMPTVKQFRQMYTTRPILILLQPGGASGQYYVCGN